MRLSNPQYQGLKTQLITFFLLFAMGFWIKSIHLGSHWQESGLATFSLGFILLASHIAAQILGTVKLPLISGYIFVGIIAGPYVTGFLNEIMVSRLRIVDDLALSFIALTAGGALQLEILQKRAKAIAINILLQTIMIFLLVFISFLVISPHSAMSRTLSSNQLVVLACLLGVIAVARSPSSAIAIINECHAAGHFTATVLGVTVAMDVIIIMLFTLAMTVGDMMMGAGAMDFQILIAICLAVAGSLILGAVLGKGIAVYVEKVGHDLPLFLLFFAFGVFKVSEWFNHFMESHFATSLYLEPLLICISAGFFVQNFSKSGHLFMENMERMALPIYVLFFSLAGAGLNLKALYLTWPLAAALVAVRAASIFGSTWLAGTVTGEPLLHRRIAWMSYLAQAGVSIGLAQLAQRQFPEIGSYLTTLVLAVITINQIVGPVTFKVALNMAGETGQGDARHGPSGVSSG